jgi:hypothetical protein
VWEKELTDEEVKAIYNATRKPQVASGIDTNPARILLQERDNATGSYPTIARTGDPDFTGQYASTFDDTNTIIFGGGNLVYPTNLPASSKFVSGGVATPNILQGLTAAGTSSAGTADAHVSFTPGENISPFDESRIYIDNDAEFYATGTASGTIRHSTWFQSEAQLQDYYQNPFNSLNRERNLLVDRDSSRCWRG